MILLTLYACTDITFALHGETARVAAPVADSADTGGWWDTSDTGGGGSWDTAPDVGETVGSFGDEVELALSTPTVNFIRTADVNGDGRQDIVFTGSAMDGWVSGDRPVILGVGVQQSDGSFSFTETTLDITNGIRAYLEVGDVNGDGYDDAVVGHYDGWTVFYGDSAGSLATTDAHSDAWTTALSLGDLDDDGDLDLAALNTSLEAVVLTNDGSGDFTETDRWNPNWLYAGGDWDYTDIQIKDVDGDGVADLTALYPWQAGSDPYLYVYEGDGAGFDHDGVGYSGASTGAGPYQVTLGDFDSDSDTDLVLGVAWPYYAIAGTTWTGSHFGADLAWESGLMAPYVFEAADVDGDGDDDLMSSSVFQVEILTQVDGELQSSGAYDVATTATGSVATVNLTLGDMDGDGCMDVVSSRYPDGLVIVPFLCDASTPAEDSGDSGEEAGDPEDTGDTGEPAARPKSGFCATSPASAGWGALVALGVALGARRRRV